MFLNTLRYKLRFKDVLFYNAALTEVQKNVVIGKGSRIGSFTLIHQDVQIGENCTIGSHCNICRGVKIGDQVIIQTGCHITSGVEIKSGCFIGPGVLTMNDKYMDGTLTPPAVGKDAKIGGGTCILPGIVIGNHALVGSSSVVVKHVKNNESVFGNPAKPRKKPTG